MNLPHNSDIKTPKNTERITFEDLFNLDDIQQLQDEFTEATGVASIITHTDGTPITAPSNFCRLCRDIIRKSDKGLQNCFKSDAAIGIFHPEGPLVQQCLSGGLWDAGAGITVGGQHIANWLIGQVRNETQTEENMIKYAQEIDVDEQAFIEAFREVPSMPHKQFCKIAQMLFTLANQLSTIAYQNVLQAKSIAELKQTEESLQKSEQKYRRIVENLRKEYFFFAHDIDGIFTYVSPSVTQMLGYGVDEFKTHFSTYLTNNPVNNEVIRHSQESSKGIKQPPYLVETFHKGGGTRWLEVVETPIFDENGKVITVEGIAHDITHQRKAESALLENEERFRAISESSIDAIIASDADSRIIYWNKAASDMYGYEPHEIVGQSSSILMTSDNARSEQEGRRDFNGTKSISYFEAPFESIGVKKDGTRFPIEVALSSWKVDDGYYFSAIIRDITVRKQVEEQLQRNEKILNTTQQLVRVGGWEIDLEKGTSFWTDEVYRIHDLEPHKFTSIDEGVKVSLECYDPEDRQVISDAFNKCAEKGQAYDLEFPFSSTKGHRKWVRTIANPVMQGDKITKVVGYFMDVTEQKKLEDNLRQAQKMESIGTLAGGIAHDFNNILGAIMGYSELVLDEVEDRPETFRSIQEILSATNRAKDLVGQVLTFSRSTEIEKKPVKTIPIVKEVCKFLRSSLPTAIEINQHINIDSDKIMADPTQFHQVLMNLCTNAGHAMKKKGGVLDVILEQAIIEEKDLAIHSDLKTGKYLGITVMDTGHGISQDNLDRVFEPYFTTKGKGEGTGLGLAVVHGIVKDCGGDISVYSEVDKGTAFHILLPLLQEQSDSMLSKETIPLPTGTESVMFVDDEETLVKIGKLQLERLGYKVTGITNAEEALEIFKHSGQSYDIVITDKTMPKMSGFDLAQEIKKIHPETPVIICTGFQEKTDENNVSKAFINAIIMKPINKREIAETIRAVLDKKEI